MMFKILQKNFRYFFKAGALISKNPKKNSGKIFRYFPHYLFLSPI